MYIYIYIYYVFINLQNGDECRCGMIYGRYQDRDDSECSNCQAQSDKKCGARWYNSVYKHRYDFSHKHFGKLSTLLYI